MAIKAGDLYGMVRIATNPRCISGDDHWVKLSESL